MRSFWVGLVLLAVLIAGLRTIRSEAWARKSAPAAPPPDREVEVVKGYGTDAAKAEERAIEKAQDEVRDLLGGRFGTVWPEVLDPQYLAGFGVINRVGEPVPVRLKDGDWLVVSYRVRLTPEYLREVTRFAQHQQMSDRNLIAARVLAGLVVLLLVVTGYLRLEELTRGYATTKLRAAAVAILVVAGLGLMLIA